MKGGGGGGWRGGEGEEEGDRRCEAVVDAGDGRPAGGLPVPPADRGARHLHTASRTRRRGLHLLRLRARIRVVHNPGYH